MNLNYFSNLFIFSVLLKFNVQVLKQRIKIDRPEFHQTQLVKLVTTLEIFIKVRIVNYQCSSLSWLPVSSDFFMLAFSVPTSSTPAVLDNNSFQRSVLRLLHAMDHKIEDISSNQARLSLHLLPNQKYQTKPKGMPNTPIQNERDLNKMEELLEDDDNVHYLVCSKILNGGGVFLLLLKNIMPIGFMVFILITLYFTDFTPL